MSTKILFVGESLVIHRFFDKGVLEFMIASSYEDEGIFLREALKRKGFEVDHIPTMSAATIFPEYIEEILKYDVIILSDVGSNTLLLHPEVFNKSRPRPNRLKLIKDYVVNHGKGFLMIGGYLSFQGLHGIANYKNSPIEEILPVELLNYDDRVEVPEGFNPKVSNKSHPIVRDLPETWPTLLGYNKTILKKNSTLLAEYNKDVILAVWEIGKGRTAAFTSDCAPHWCTNEFLQWGYYDTLWERIINWLAKKI
ncbi:MAG: glutamine amidotransferase [Nitrososphaeria archaeon]|nr:glutamine amidotransferase [Nitrososphaeria archaeon]MDW7987042.1 glutamine amidotransferase [Nitrososphaerota archaeon]